MRETVLKRYKCVPNLRPMWRTSLMVVMGMFAVEPAAAHHSFAAFDRAQVVVLTGTVKKWDWLNPHSWLYMVVVDNPQGQPVEWALESTSVADLTRRGWRRDSLKPGDTVTAAIHPRRDGASGGSLQSVTFPDGHFLLGFGVSAPLKATAPASAAP